MIGHDEIAAALESADLWATAAPNDFVSLKDQSDAHWRELGADPDGVALAAVEFGFGLREKYPLEAIASVEGLASTFLAGLRAGLMAERALAPERAA